MKAEFEFSLFLCFTHPKEHFTHYWFYNKVDGFSFTLNILNRLL